MGIEEVLQRGGQMVKRKSRVKWTAKQEGALRKMWVGDYTKREMSRKVRHSIPTIYVKAKKLGLPMRGVKQARLQLKPTKMLPSKGTVKCHNCLENIVLSKNGLDRDYMGGKIGNKFIFWHLPGKCPGDPSAHFNLLEHKRSRRGRPSEYDRRDR